MPQHRSFLHCFSSALVMLGASLWAQPGLAAGSGGQAGGTSWGLGLGLGYERSAYRAFDDKARLLPVLMYESCWISVAGPGLDLKLLPETGPWSLRLRSRYGFEGYEAKDSPQLAGMAERKGGVWLGGALGWQGGLGRVSAELLGDASGHSKGRQLRLQWERRHAFGRVDLTPRVAAVSLDRRYVDYYYGVRAGEARAVQFSERYERADKARGQISWKGQAQVGNPRVLEVQAGEFEVLPIRITGQGSDTPEGKPARALLFTRVVYFAPKLGVPVPIDIEDNDAGGRPLKRERIELTHAQQSRTLNN